MALRAFVKDLEELPEELQQFYSAKDGGFALDVEGAAAPDQSDLKAKVKEFRDNNVELRQKLEDYQARFSAFEDVSDEEFDQMIKAHKAMKEKEMIAASDLDRILKERLDKASAKHQKELEELQRANLRASENLSRMMIEKGVSEAINRIGQLQKGALSDVLRRANQEIEVKEDRLLERDTGISIDLNEWAQNLQKNCPFFFVPNSGIGSKGSGGEKLKDNPFKADSLNLAAQGQLYRENPSEAIRLAREAGIELST